MVSNLSFGYVLLYAVNLLTLSLYNIVYTVEPVDVWKPEANIYESGKIACHAAPFFSASQTAALPVFSSDCKRKPIQGHLRKMPHPKKRLVTTLLCSL